VVSSEHSLWCEKVKALLELFNEGAGRSYEYRAHFGGEGSTRDLVVLGNALGDLPPPSVLLGDRVPGHEIQVEKGGDDEAQWVDIPQWLCGHSGMEQEASLSSRRTLAEVIMELRKDPELSELIDPSTEEWPRASFGWSRGWLPICRAMSDELADGRGFNILRGWVFEPVVGGESGGAVRGEDQGCGEEAAG
jgi:hypothetical protein